MANNATPILRLKIANSIFQLVVDDGVINTMLDKIKAALAHNTFDRLIFIYNILTLNRVEVNPFPT